MNQLGSDAIDPSIRATLSHSMLSQTKRPICSRAVDIFFVAFRAPTSFIIILTCITILTVMNVQKMQAFCYATAVDEQES